MSALTSAVRGKAQLVPGSRWTVGRNGRFRDYSWVGDVWEVVSQRGETVWLRHRGPERRSYGGLIDVQFTEHDWHQADDLLPELQRNRDEYEAEYRACCEVAKTKRGE